MSEDGWLLGGTALVWAVLAAAYALVPTFHMPGATLLWGAGALVFLVLVLAVRRAERRPPR
ncbi:MAG: hypothetical protein K6T74_15145 [Geminicoccaceae bacterium]|nr:hypothetical protein [Geminicoccaceae bacterium]